MNVNTMEELKIRVVQKLVQYASSMLGGLLLAFETSTDFFIPCLLAIVLDVISAWFLGRRVKKKCPDRSDGKFKSEYKHRILYTMLIVWLCIILANYVDIAVRHSDDGLAVRFAVAVFLFYEAWSCLENWSSENNQPIAKALQRVMVNKAERHLNVPLRDILLKDEKPCGGRERHSKHDGEPPHRTILDKDEILRLKKNMNKNNAVIILGTAHLGSTPGKCSPDKSIREAVYSREIIADLKPKLSAYGYKVFTDYEPLEPLSEWTAARKKYGYEKGEQSRELAYRVQQVNNICKKYGTGNCLYIPIHLNGAGSDGKWHGAGGWCAITSPGRTKADLLAECFYDAAITNLKTYVEIIDEGKRRGEYTENQVPFRMDRTDGDRDLEANLYVLRKSACPAVLTENLFQDNRRDVEYLLSDDGRHAIERLHVEGIVRYVESV